MCRKATDYMKLRLHSHRHADIIIPHESRADLDELLESLASVSDSDIIERFTTESKSAKSISKAVNSLIHDRLVAQGWRAEAPIFQDANYDEQRWRLDFAKNAISVEVAFNHGEAIAWNLLKPILASEYNHVRKAIQTRFGIIVCATDAMKEAGGFDSAVGSFEKFVRYLMPFQQILTVPILLIGLEAPESFRIRLAPSNGRQIGDIERIKLD
jgi:hypothetical protein